MKEIVCKHHPEYDSTSGEPTGRCYVNRFSHMKREFRKGICKAKQPGFPCPYCLQARAKWLDEQLAKHGGHTAECAVFGRPSVRHLVSNRRHFDPDKCDCGWEAFLAKYRSKQ